MFEVIAILMPFLVAIAVVGLGHDITDRDYIETMNERTEK
jgi:hypothetical protein